MKMKDERNQILTISSRLLEAGLVMEGQGNISIYDRQTNLVAITPSAVPYNQRKAEDICIVDLNGHLLEGQWKPTSEIPLHLIFYKKRKDVDAVIHTHAPKSTVFGLFDQKQMPMVLTEAAMKLGGAIPIAPYARPGSEELAEVTFTAVGNGLAAIMAHHGAITVGASLEKAYAAAIAVEMTAKTLIYARALDREPIALDEEEVKDLYRLYQEHKPQKRNQSSS
jgi:L-ribulose-5-phosphate 4-epimerase